MIDRVLLGKNDASDVGLWVSKPGAGVTDLAGNTYLKSFDDWYGTQWEFNGPGDNDVGARGQHGENGWLNSHSEFKYIVESFNSGLINPNGGSGTNNQYFKKTSNGTILWSGGARFPDDPAPKMYTPHEIDGSGNPTKNAFIGSDYPIIEVRARRLPLIDVSQSGGGGPMTGTGVTAGLNFVPTRPADMRVTFRNVPIDSGGAGTLGHGETVGLYKPIPGSYKSSFPDYEMSDDDGNALDIPGEWKILEWDMSNVQGWSDPWAFNGFPAAGPFSSSYRITQLGFKFTAAPGGGVNPTFWDSWFDPMWEIDYVRVKRKGVPKAAGPYGNYQESLIFDSDWSHTGLVHQTGVVTIGTAKAWIDGTTSDRVVGHNIDNDANGYVSFPALDYIPLVLFQRIDEKVADTGVSYPGGEDEFSICTTKWEDFRYPTVDMNTSEPSWKSFDIHLLNYGLNHSTAIHSPSEYLTTSAHLNNTTGISMAAKENFYVATSNSVGVTSLPSAPWDGSGTIWNQRDLEGQDIHAGTGAGSALGISGLASLSMWDEHHNTPSFPFSLNNPSVDRTEIPNNSERGRLLSEGNGGPGGTRTWDSLASFFSETRTFAYARAKKDGFWLSCRNAIAQEGMEPALNLAPVLPEDGLSDQGLAAYVGMVSNNDTGAWGMFHPALALYDGTKFTEGLQLKWDSVMTANLALLDKVGAEDVGGVHATKYNQYNWWPNFSCSGLLFDGSLARTSNTLLDTVETDYKKSYSKLLAGENAAYWPDGNGILQGDTGGFYPYRLQVNDLYHKHYDGTGAFESDSTAPPRQDGSYWLIPQYNAKRISSKGIFHPEGIVPVTANSYTNRNIEPEEIGTIANQSSYLGGSLNTKIHSSLAISDSSFLVLDTKEITTLYGPHPEVSTLLVSPYPETFAPISPEAFFAPSVFTDQRNRARGSVSKCKNGELLVVGEHLYRGGAFYDAVSPEGSKPTEVRVIDPTDGSIIRTLLGGQIRAGGTSPGPGGGWPRHDYNLFHSADQSPDGNKVIFSTTQQQSAGVNRTAIEVMDFDPVDPNAASVMIIDPGYTPLGTASARPDALMPSWNPAGDKIVFISNIGTTGPGAGSGNVTYGIYVADVNQANPVACNSPTLIAGGQGDLHDIRNIHGESCFSYPRWSPDGNKIIFGETNIFTISSPFDGSSVPVNHTAEYLHLRGVIPGEEGVYSSSIFQRHTTSGSFSPDGTYILFSSQGQLRAGEVGTELGPHSPVLGQTLPTTPEVQNQLWVMRADGSDEPALLDSGDFLGININHDFRSVEWTSDNKILAVTHPSQYPYMASMIYEVKETTMTLKNTAFYDNTKTMPPKYKYWVLRVPVNIPEYTS